MIRFEMKTVSGQLSSSKVRQRIRRRIRKAIEMGNTVLLDFEGTHLITREDFVAVVDHWAPEKVRIVAENFREWLPPEHQVPGPKLFFKA